MNKKILFLGHFPPPYHGVAIFNKKILESSLAERFDFDFLAISTAGSLQDIERFSLTKARKFGGIFFKLLKKLFCRRFALCYFSLTPTGKGFFKDLFFVFLVKCFKVKMLYHLHGKGISLRKNGLERCFYRWSYKNAKVILLGSNLYYDVQDYVGIKDVYVLPNAVEGTLSDEEFFCLSGKRANKRILNLLFLSNIAKSKGALTVLDAAGLLKEGGFDFKLFFAGNWFDIKQEDFSARVKQLGLIDRVEYLGFKYGIQKQQLLKDSDILVYPTCNDTFPLVILEAMEYGLVIVTTRQGAIPEEVEDGVSGFFIPEEDPQELNRILQTVCKDTNVRMAMSRAARSRFLRNYTYRVFEKRFGEILEQEIAYA